jgi:hypothetical protein
VKTRPRIADCLRRKYRLDYSQAKPNRFASDMNRPVVAIVLDSNVAAASDSSAKENAQSAITSRKAGDLRPASAMLNELRQRRR